MWNISNAFNVNTNRRIANYSQNVGMMYRLLKHRNVPRQAKLHGDRQDHKATCMGNNKKAIHAADMKVLRLIKCVTRRDKIRNVYEFHIKPILDVIGEGKFRYLGHVMRREGLEQHG